MAPSLLVLALIATAPSQGGVNEPSPYPAPYTQLGYLYLEAVRSHTYFTQATDRHLKACEALREKDATLGKRLAVLREVVRLSDHAYRIAKERQQRYERAYRLTPNSTYRGIFMDKQREICRYRAASRMLVYLEVANHRWAWERGEKNFNGCCLEALAGLFGMKDDLQTFLLRVGAVEAELTNLLRILLPRPGR